jgi:predicted amidohydrolase
VIVAALQYPIEPVGSIAGFIAKFDRVLRDASAGGAQLVVVPEYAAMELTSALPAALAHDLPGQLRALQDLVPRYRAACADAARRHRVHLVAGSIPEFVDGEYRNRTRVYAPSGADVAIDKSQMTRFERERWGISSGSGPAVVDTALGTLGVAICYDSEFPLLVRRQVEAGARVIVVPSCTDAVAGYWRVRIACQARALENQCYVVQAPTVGAAPWSPAVDDNHGAAAIYAPPDRGFPDDGVVAIGPIDQPAVVFAQLDLAAIDLVRVDGQVLGHRDWDRPAHLAAPVRRWSLR